MRFPLPKLYPLGGGVGVTVRLSGYSITEDTQ